jgi:Fur family transcriptional regulator, ferric uptake regulator
VAAAPTIDTVDTELRQTLHRRGLRMTPQRQLVLDAVSELGHATPEAVCSKVQETAPAVNITTVYRTLDLLEQLGVVRHTHLGHGAPTYATGAHEHVHLVCHRCGGVSEVDAALLDDLAGTLARQTGFALDATHVALSGLCAGCDAAGDSEPVEPARRHAGSGEATA